MHPKLGCKKVIKDGVEAAAQARHAQRHWVKLEHHPSDGAAGHDTLLHHQVEREVEVVRSEAEQKENEAAHHHPQSTPLLAICVLFIRFLRLAVGGD